MRFIILPLLLAVPALAQQPPAATTTPAAARPAATAPSMLKPVPPPPSDTSLPRQRIVTVFGAEPCPKANSTDEVVVCARLPESEIYRIPAPLRQARNRQSVFVANRALLLGDRGGGAGASIGSCSVNGPGGWTGCNQSQIDAWASDRTDRMGYNETVPKP
jgi:hypothetical protein